MVTDNTMGRARGERTGPWLPHERLEGVGQLVVAQRLAQRGSHLRLGHGWVHVAFVVIGIGLGLAPHAESQPVISQAIPLYCYKNYYKNA